MNFVFIGISALLIGMLLVWGFRSLPREEWQIMVTVPRKRVHPGIYCGTNFTFYGFFTATAQTIAVIYLCILVFSLGQPLPVASVLFLAAFELILAWVAATLIARFVEKRQNTFTVCGAFFACIVTTPWVIVFINRAFPERSLPFMPLLAAAAIAYCMGEGIGRLACISFGCCYGKPLSCYTPGLQRFLAPWCLIFEGKTKKIAYDGGLEGQKVFPIQAITSVIFVATALVGTYLHLKGSFSATLVFTVAATQIWRSVSEFMRADDRGARRITPYQIMSATTVLYVLGIVLFAPWEPNVVPQIQAGLLRTWNPTVLIASQLIWIAAFIYFGRSKVTGSVVSLHVNKEIPNVF